MLIPWREILKGALGVILLALLALLVGCAAPRTEKQADYGRCKMFAFDICGGHAASAHCRQRAKQECMALLRYSWKNGTLVKRPDGSCK